MRSRDKYIALLAFVAVLFAVPMAMAAPPEKVTICHAAGQEGTDQFVTLVLPYNAVFGQAGHFNEDGTPQAGHEDDYLGECIKEEPTSTSTTSSSTSTTQQPTTTTASSTTTTAPTTTSSSTSTTTTIQTTTTGSVTTTEPSTTSTTVQQSTTTTSLQGFTTTSTTSVAPSTSEATTSTQAPSTTAATTTSEPTECEEGFVLNDEGECILPVTGVDGTTPFTILGIGALLLGSALLVGQRRSGSGHEGQ